MHTILWLHWKCEQCENKWKRRWNDKAISSKTTLVSLFLLSFYQRCTGTHTHTHRSQSTDSYLENVKRYRYHHQHRRFWSDFIASKRFTQIHLPQGNIDRICVIYIYNWTLHFHCCWNLNKAIYLIIKFNKMFSLLVSPRIFHYDFFFSFFSNFIFCAAQCENDLLVMGAACCFLLDSF